MFTLVRIRWPIFSKRPLSWNLNPFFCLWGCVMDNLVSKYDADSRSSLGFSFSCCLNCSRFTALILAREREEGNKSRLLLHIKHGKKTAVVNSNYCCLKHYSENIKDERYFLNSTRTFLQKRTRVLASEALTWKLAPDFSPVSDVY